MRIIKVPLLFKDGTLFADDFVRIVHGGRGSYVELTKEQIQVELISKFNNDKPHVVGNEDFFYYWLLPKGRNEKVYLQLKTVNYADYKIGMYYISPDLIIFGNAT